MKIKQETTLFRVLTGSRLYGTFNDESDYDYKAVALPGLDDLLLTKRIQNRKERPEGLGSGDKMVEGGVETEYVSIQQFMADFYAGQTYALEIAFAVKQGLVTPNQTEVWVDAAARLAIVEMVDRFLTNDISKMVGYAVVQARAYGLKTKRYTAVKTFLDEVKRVMPTSEVQQATKVGEVQSTLDLVLALEYVEQTVLENARGGMESAPALDVAGKKFPFANTWYSVIKSMEGTLASYGNRVKQFDGEGTDWKALSHALRITEQVLELTRTGTIQFPRPNAQYLRDAKEGKLPLEDVTQKLSDAFDQVDEAVENSKLQHKSAKLDEEFHQFQLRTVYRLYDL